MLYDSLNYIVVGCPGVRIFILGDLNFPYFFWIGGDNNVTSVHMKDIFFYICNDLLPPSSNKPTRITFTSSSLEDLVLATTPGEISFIIPGFSDHSILHFTYDATTTKAASVKTIKDYKSAEVASINAEFKRFTGSYLSSIYLRAVKSRAFQNAAEPIIIRFIPQRKIRQSPFCVVPVSLNRLRNRKKWLYCSTLLSKSLERRSSYQNDYKHALLAAKPLLFH